MSTSENKLHNNYELISSPLHILNSMWFKRPDDQLFQRILNYKLPYFLFEKIINKTKEHTPSNWILAGFVYEVYVYELLMQWASQNTAVHNFLLKGPYQNKVSKYYKHGFVINPDQQIKLKLDGRSFGEYDAFFQVGDSYIFVEITMIQKMELLAKLKKRIFHKQRILEYITQSKEVYCLLISPKLKAKNPLKKLTSLFKKDVPFPASLYKNYVQKLTNRNRLSISNPIKTNALFTPRSYLDLNENIQTNILKTKEDFNKDCLNYLSNKLTWKKFQSSQSVFFMTNRSNIIVELPSYRKNELLQSIASQEYCSEYTAIQNHPTERIYFSLFFDFGEAAEIIFNFLPARISISVPIISLRFTSTKNFSIKEISNGTRNYKNLMAKSITQDPKITINIIFSKLLNKLQRLL